MFCQYSRDETIKISKPKPSIFLYIALSTPTGPMNFLLLFFLIPSKSTNHEFNLPVKTSRQQKIAHNVRGNGLNIRTSFRSIDKVFFFQLLNFCHTLSDIGKNLPLRFANYSGKT